MKAEDFFAKPRKVEFFGEEVEIRPLTVDYLPLVYKVKNGNATEKGDAIYELSFSVFKQIFPDTTKEDFKKVSFDAIDRLMEIFWEINEDSEKQKAKEVLKNAK